MANVERPTRPSTASRAAPIDVLSREVEEMEMAEQEVSAHAARSQARSDDSDDDDFVYQQNHGPNDHRQTTGAAPPPPPPPAAFNAPAAPGQMMPAPPRSEQQQHTHHQQQQIIQSVPRSVDVAPAVIDTSNLREFLMRPGPQGAMVQCYIQRRKTGLARLYPTYEVYLKDGEQFLLAARRRKKQKQSNYKVSLDKDDLSRDSSNYFGKLKKADFMGTVFEMYDSGINPDKLSDAQKDGSHVQVRQELATVLYKQNVLGSRGPRKMKVIVPNVDESGNRVVLRPTTHADSMLERYKVAKNDNDVQILKNKQPKWNDQVGAYVLNFNGRVTRASVKNFQLCNVARDRKRAACVVLRRAAALPFRSSSSFPQRPIPPPSLALTGVWPLGCFRSRPRGDAIRPRGQGRVHDGLSVAALWVAGVRHRAEQLRLQDCMRVVRISPLLNRPLCLPPSRVPMVQPLCVDAFRFDARRQRRGVLRGWSSDRPQAARRSARGFDWSTFF